MRINKKILAGITAVSVLGCGIWMESVAAADVTEFSAGDIQEAATEEALSDAELSDSETESAADISDEVAETPASEESAEIQPDTSETEENPEELGNPEQPESEEASALEQQGEASFESEEALTDPEEAAKSGFCGAKENAVEWSLSEDGVLEITGQGEMQTWENEEQVPWNTYRDQITKVTVKDGVTSIGAYAFADCENLSELDVADSVQTIGAFAYFNCNGLSTLTIG